jgi:hypothetical protein
MPMARSVTTSFRSSDDTLRMLVTARREEVQRLQKAQADQLNDLETRGHERIASLRRTLPATFVEVLDALDKTHEEASAATKSHVEGVKARQADATVSPENETGAHPGLAGGHLVAPNSLGWFTPYYGVLHASDGTVYWQGYIPPAKLLTYRTSQTAPGRAFSVPARGRSPCIWTGGSSTPPSKSQLRPHHLRTLPWLLHLVCRRRLLGFQRSACAY